MCPGWKLLMLQNNAGSCPEILTCLTGSEAVRCPRDRYAPWLGLMSPERAGWDGGDGRGFLPQGMVVAQSRNPEAAEKGSKGPLQNNI